MPFRMTDLLQSASPGGLCIQCIADRMPLSHRSHVLELIEDLPPTFIRGTGVCASCQQTASVTKFT
jgi:hypothetical protein